MKKLLVSFVGGTVAFTVHAQILFTFDFAGADPAGDAQTPTAEHLAVSPFTRANVNAASQTDVFASSYWTQLPTRDPGEFLSFTFGPEAGYQLDLASLAWNISRTATGPQSGLVEVFKNGASLALTPEFAIGTTMATHHIDLAGVSGVGDDRFECRFYGWNASSTGNLRLDTVSLDGAVLAIPEPKTASLFAVAGLVAFVVHRHCRRG